MRIAVNLAFGWLAGLIAGASTLFVATEIERAFGLLSRVFTAPMVWFDLRASLAWGCVVGLVAMPILGRSRVSVLMCYVAQAVLCFLGLAVLVWFILPQAGGKLPAQFVMNTAPLVFLSVPSAWLMLQVNKQMKERLRWNTQGEKPLH